MKRGHRTTGLLFLLPAIVIYAVFNVIPFADTFMLSFTEWNGFSERQFIGLQNYAKAMSDATFGKAVYNSVMLGFGSAFFSVTVGVLLAWMMLYISRRRGAVCRTVLFSPSMIPLVITGLIFTFVFDPDVGILNTVLRLIGLQSLEHAWLTNRSTALWCIMFVAAWKQMGMTMILTFAGIQSVDVSVLEAAKVDGATEVKLFTNIILPTVKQFIQLSMIFALTSGLKIYDTVLVLTNGGPAKATVVMPLHILQNAYSFNSFGYAAAMAMVFVVIVLMGILLVRNILGGEE